VMRFVQKPSHSMHDIFMHEPGKTFHESERDNEG